MIGSAAGITARADDSEVLYRCTRKGRTPFDLRIRDTHRITLERGGDSCLTRYSRTERSGRRSYYVPSTRTATACDRIAGSRDTVMMFLVVPHRLRVETPAEHPARLAVRLDLATDEGDGYPQEVYRCAREER